MAMAMAMARKLDANEAMESYLTSDRRFQDSKQMSKLMDHIAGNLSDASPEMSGTNQETRNDVCRCDRRKKGRWEEGRKPNYVGSTDVPPGRSNGRDTLVRIALRLAAALRRVVEVSDEMDYIISHSKLRWKGQLIVECHLFNLYWISYLWRWEYPSRLLSFFIKTALISRPRDALRVRAL
jgi:hypothetical protein